MTFSILGRGFLGVLLWAILRPGLGFPRLIGWVAGGMAAGTSDRLLPLGCWAGKRRSLGLGRTVGAALFVSAGLLGGGRIVACQADSVAGFGSRPAAVDEMDRMLAAGEYTLALAAVAGGRPEVRPGDSVAAGLPERLADAQGLARVLAHQHAHRSWEAAAAHGGAVGLGLGGGGGSNFGGDGHATGTGSGTGLEGTMGRSERGRGGHGQSGGMMQADFTSLINLIQTTVDPNSWEENGGTGTISTFPNGVLIDVAGQLRFPTGQSSAAKSRLGLTAGRPDRVDTSSQRYVSLPKLEAALQQLAVQGQPIPESLYYLGGLYEVRSVAVDPVGGDLVLIGPAGPWDVNAQGVAVNRATGRPVLHLDDLVACLRNVYLGRGVLGCSIDPRPGQFQQVAELAGKWNLTVPHVREKFLTAVGPQDTVVFGVPKTSHAAQVLLTADYHIKLLAMGSVKAGPRLPSYLDRCQADDPASEVIRWWFTVAEPVIHRDPQRSLYHLHGPYMELKTEAQLLAGRGAAGPPPPRSLAAEAFVGDFNRQLPELRRWFPVYGQLENLFHLAVVAQLIRGQELATQAGWEPTFLLGRNDDPRGYALRRYPEIREVQWVINHRTLQVRDPLPVDRSPVGRLKRQTIVAISGGVEIQWSADRLQSALQTPAPDGPDREVVRGWERSRALFQPRSVGPREGAATLPAAQWYVD